MAPENTFPTAFSFKRSKRIWIIFTLLVLLSSMRIVHLGADPPHDLSRSMGYMSDPGGYVFNARNKVVFGEWEMDMWNIMHISPLPHYLTYLSFRVFGTGIAQMNLIPVIFSILILITTFLIFQKKGTAAAVTAVFLLGINYQLTMFSRIAVRVMPMLFFALLAVYFAQKALSQQKNHWLILSGISAFLSFTVKATFVQILPALFLGLGFTLFFHFSPGMKRALFSLGYFITGFAASGAAWLAAFYFPHREIFQAYGGENITWLTPNSFNEIIKNFWGRPLYYLNEAPVLFSLASLFIIILIYRAFTSPKKIAFIEWTSGIWLISNLLYCSMIFYHAARHTVALMVPVVFLAFGMLSTIIHARKISKPAFPAWPFILFLYGWLLFPISNVMIYLSRPLTPASLHNATLKLLILDGIICGMIVIGLKKWPRRLTFSLPRPAVVSIAAVLILASGWFNLKPYFQWAARPFYRIQTISRDLGRTYEHMVLAGLITPLISLENTFEAHPYRAGYINPYDDFIQRFGITHVFPTIHAHAIEKTEYFRDFPEAMRDAELMARYPLWQTYAELYALDPAPEALPEDVISYEGETFFGSPGMPRFDEQAFHKTALFIEKKHDGALAQLPLKEFDGGGYSARFIVKIEDPTPESPFVLKMDVVDRKRKKLLASRNLSAGEFTRTGEYFAFDLPFQVPRKAALSLRVYSPGAASIWLDRVTIQNTAPAKEQITE
ncbi:MAG: glycosyltransferase family 39 protein [Candidatus Aminicenantes bacterium]